MSAPRQARRARAAPRSEPAAAGGEADDATRRIGEQLAHLRGERDLKISDLARRISVSPSLISQIERGQSRPSVTTLFALAQELKVPVDAFFETQAPPEPASGRAPGRSGTAASAIHTGVWPDRDDGSESGRYLLKHGERPTVEIRGGVRWERLTRAALNDLEFMELVYQPGAESDPQLYRHPGLECVLVTENRLDITVGFEVNHVMAGDSIAFPSSLPHRYTNPTDRVSRAVTAIVHDGLSTLHDMVPPSSGSGRSAASA